MHVRQTDSGQNAPDHACRGGDAQSTALDAERIASLERDKAALERNVAALTAQ